MASPMLDHQMVNLKEINNRHIDTSMFIFQVEIKSDEAAELIEFVKENIQHEARVQAALQRICDLETVCLYFAS